MNRWNSAGWNLHKCAFIASRTAREIADLLGEPVQRVRPGLHRLRREGMGRSGLNQAGCPLWRLAREEREAESLPLAPADDSDLNPNHDSTETEAQREMRMEGRR